MKYRYEVTYETLEVAEARRELEAEAQRNGSPTVSAMHDDPRLVVIREGSIPGTRRF